MALRPLACSTVLARVEISVEMPVTAKTAARIRTATSAGGPQLACTIRVVATTMVAIATTPRTIPASAPPRMIAPAGIGAARSRPRVPSRRSASSASVPYWAAKKTNMIAIAAP